MGPAIRTFLVVRFVWLEWTLIPFGKTGGADVSHTREVLRIRQRSDRDL